MADIRYTTTILDDFERPDENPIQFPWETNWPVTPIELRTGGVGSPNVNPSVTAQSVLTTACFAGDEIEVWGISRGNAAQADSYRIGLLSSDSTPSGYLLRCANPVGPDFWEIRKYTNSAFSVIASASGATLPAIGDLVLMQLTATNVNCYLSEDNGANWVLQVSAADSTYRTDMCVHAGANGSQPGWDGIGGGVPGMDWIPQIYRRIHNTRRRADLD